jgi:UDP-N-acetylglucosamine acyltransferase
MSSPLIHPTAIIHPGARIDPSCRIGPYCVIEDDVVMGADNRLDSHVVVKRYTTIGEANHFYAGSQFSTDPLDHGFDERDVTYLRIGNANSIRECVTISRGTPAGSETVLGDGNYIMCNVHVAHNCRLGNGVTVGTCTGLGGWSEIGDNAFVSVNAGLHQFSKVGRLAMVAGHTRVVQDVPPFFLVSDFDAAAHGLNFVGLRRAGYSREAVGALKQAYRLLYRSGLTRAEAIAQIEALATPETRELVDFIRASKRGIVRDFRHARAVTLGLSPDEAAESGLD